MPDEIRETGDRKEIEKFYRAAIANSMSELGSIAERYAKEMKKEYETIPETLKHYNIEKAEEDRNIDSMHKSYDDLVR